MSDLWCGIRRSFVHERSVRIDGSLPDGKMPLVRKPMTSVSWFVAVKKVRLIPCLRRHVNRLARHNQRRAPDYRAAGHSGGRSTTLPLPNAT